MMMTFLDNNCMNTICGWTFFRLEQCLNEWAGDQTIKEMGCTFDHEFWMTTKWVVKALKEMELSILNEWMFGSLMSLFGKFVTPSRPATWYSHYLVFARIPNTKYHIFMYSQVCAPLNRPFLASWEAWLEHECILENLNRQLFQKLCKLMAYAASCVLANILEDAIKSM